MSLDPILQRSFADTVSPSSRGMVRRNHHRSGSDRAVPLPETAVDDMAALVILVMGEFSEATYEKRYREVDFYNQQHRRPLQVTQTLSHTYKLLLGFQDSVELQLWLKTWLTPSLQFLSAHSAGEEENRVHIHTHTHTHTYTHIHVYQN